jgi:hypothetical protein
MKKKIFLRFMLVAIFVSFNMGCNARFFSPTDEKTDTTGKKSFRLFKDDSPIDISLKFDLTTYFREKPQNEYLSAALTFHLGKTDSIERNIRLKTRGVFRNKYCRFAPIELNMKKVDFGYTDLNRIGKLKLVPQCNTGKEKEDYVLREYLAYKLFNVLTDTSFRVRLLTVTYIDSKKNRKPVKQYGFFIEPVEMILARTKTIQIKSTALNQKSIIPGIMDRLAIFNFMIGNYDWSVPGLHNILALKPLEYEPDGRLIAVPHDFDWTGLVNAAYAIPTEAVGTENVRERIFMGVCRSREVFYKELDLFIEKKADFYRVINEFPYLSAGVKKDITRYLDSFFDKLGGNRDLVLYSLMNTCKHF